jgi:hypothetical protein
MKIGFNSQAEWQKLKQRVPNPAFQNEILVSGRVVADPTQPLGYYLDPATTSVPDGTFPEAIYSMREVTEKMGTWAGYDVYVIFRVKVENYL